MGAQSEVECIDCGTIVSIAAQGEPAVHLARCGRLCWNASMDAIEKVMVRAVERDPGRSLLHTPGCPQCAAARHVRS